MKAEHPKPTLPAAPPPAGVPGMATEPIPDAHQGHEEPNALRRWLTATWEKLKSGQMGNPKWIALVVAVAAVGVAWWYFARSSKKADSALWVNYDLAVTPQGFEEFLKQTSAADTEAGRLVRSNQLRTRADDGVRGLTAGKRADRLKAAKGIEEARDELVALADQFPRDRTMKVVCLQAAADAELALVGVPKEGVVVPGLDRKADSRGQVERVAELKRKAAEAVGPDTDAGKRFTAEAEKLTKDTATVYATSGPFFATFNEPDAADRPEIPVPPPTGLTPPGTGGGDAPKPPDKPLDPVNPLKPDDKKPDEKKDDGPKAPAPLAPANPDKK